MQIKIIEAFNRVNKNIWFILIFIAATLFYLYNINFSNIWIDEAFTKALLKHSFGEITALIKNDFHPPLYFYALKIFVTIFGITDFTIRLFSVLGVLSTLVLGYFVGEKIFGKAGALYFCLLILSLPMVAEFSHEARMYTWGAFTVTGVFLYAALYISSKNQDHLILLMFFSLLAAYTHYYALLSALWANLFLFAYHLVTKSDKLKIHLIYSLIITFLYLPWLLVMISQTNKVSQSFWVPALSWQSISSCLLSPFAPKIYLPPFLPLAILFYALVLWVLYRNYLSGKEKHGVVLELSLCMFFCTILTAVIASIFMQPILYMRYIANIIVLLLVPAALFFISVKSTWIKGIVLAVILIFGVNVSIDGSFFSFGPYEQSLSHLQKKHPEVKKIFHVLEATAGPFAEYAGSGIKNYWYNPKSTIVYTNMSVFNNMPAAGSLGEVLKIDEPFCLANFPYMPFNENNVKRILSESQITTIDTVVR